MNKIKHNDTEDSRLFVTGCLHLNHDPKWDIPIWRTRGYDSAVAMTDGIIGMINAICHRENDILLVLGDFCLNTSKDMFYDTISRINPKMWFLCGNHNNPWARLYKDASMKQFGCIAAHWSDIPEFGGKISYVGNYTELIWNREFFVCFHYPIAVWDKMGNGAKALVSHSHGNYGPSLPHDTTEKQLDCGWDVWGVPLAFDGVMNTMNKKQIPKKDHH